MPGSRKAAERVRHRRFYNGLTCLQNRRGILLLGFVRNAAQDFFDGAQLLRLVIDDEILFVAQFLDVLA